MSWLKDFVDDLFYALRSLRRTPAHSALVVLTLALGIGLTTTPFSMVDALIFRPYPVPHPGRVVNLVSTSRDNGFDAFSYREYRDIRAHTRSYNGVIANAPLRAVGFSVGRADTPRIRAGMTVSGNYFRVLDVEPQLGRGFREDEDDVPGRDAVVVLGPDFWKREFGGDASVVGKTIRLNGLEFTVIGIAPDSFPGMQIFVPPDFYLPLAMTRVLSANTQKNFFEDRDDRLLSVKARLRTDATLVQARNELALLAKDFAHDYPQFNRDRGGAVRTQFEMRTQEDDINWKFSVIFAVLAMAVLLVACTNVAGLLLSRARSRTREIAVRLALGAGRFRLIRLLLTESLLLSGLGGVGGIAVGYAGITYLSKFRIPSELPVTVPFRMDSRVLMASMVLSAVSALLCGLAPALQSTRADLVNGLKAADADVPGRGRLWGRNALVVAQVSASLMLLAASFLMIRGFEQSLAEGTGFARDHLLMSRFDPRLVQYDPPKIEQFYKLLTERARLAPGVRSAGLTQTPPLGLDNFDSLALVPDGAEMPRNRDHVTSTMDTVDEGYFDTIGIRIVRGRGVLASDTADAPRVAVVNEQFARHYWPGADAVGKHFRLENRTGPLVEVVGVTQTIKYRQGSERPTDFVYLPLAQHPVPRMILLVRTEGDPLQFADALKDIIRTLNPNLPMMETRTYEDLYRYHAVEGPRVAIELVGIMGGVGLLLAIAGLYGLVAYNVSRRTREIGIRIAIGAGQADVLRLVMGKGLMLVGIGTAIGIAMSVAVERLMNSMLFNAGGIDIVAYLTVVPAMVLATMVAAYVPARRASRIAPTHALRCE